MANINVTLSGPEMTQLNQARAQAGFDTLEQFATALIKDQSNNQKVIDDYAKANQVAAKKAVADADAEKKKAAGAFRSAQRKAAAKAAKKGSDG